MSRTQAPEWVKRNISLPSRERMQLDALAEVMELSSDSEVIRQSLRYYDQLSLDEESGCIFYVERIKNEIINIHCSSFFDKTSLHSLNRRSLIFHINSDERLKNLLNRLGRSDPSEIVRGSLRFLHFILDEAKNGSRFYIKRPKERKPMEIRLGFIVSEPTPRQNNLASEDGSDSDDDSLPNRPALASRSIRFNSGIK